MNCNSEELIKDIRAKFENILNFVSGEAASKATADTIERNLLYMLSKYILPFNETCRKKT